MPELRCPMCGKDNPESEVNCVHCGARLVPLGETPPAPDAGPVSEEKDILSMLLEEDDGAPVDESQEFMEWLDKELSSEESGDEADLADETSEEASTEELLAALVSEPEDEKQISEWLHSMDQTVIVPDREPADEEDESDDAADLFAFPADELQEDEEDEESLSEEELLAQRTAIPDWFKDLLAEEPAEGPEAPEVLAESVDAVTPEWEALEDEAVDETTADFTESEPEEFVPAEEIPPLPGWFNQVLEEETPESAAPEFAAEKPEEIGEEPDWMKQPELAEDETGLEDILPEHLAESMDGQTIIEGVTAETRAVPAAELPGWFSDVEDTLGGEAVESAPESPEQLAAAEEETEAKPEKKGLFASLFGRGKRRKKSEAVPSDAPEEVPEELPRMEEAEKEIESVLPEAEEEPVAVEQPGSDEIESLFAEEPEFVFADETSEGDGLEALLAEELEPEMETGEPSFDQAAVEEAAAEELLTTSAEDTAEPVSELEALLAEEEFESEWAEETAEPREVVEAGV
ncbi:MAG: zinc ribbon domain-containing protein, partial [Anaerolineaceae bacterium]|nr:zinc ribbon domain-containing protein [Anaerolineaceae bacterium]